MPINRFVNLLMRAGLPSTVTQDWGYTPYILSIIANSLWPISWIYCNESKISFAQSTMARGIVTLLISYLACTYSGQPHPLKYSNNFRILALRSFLMTLHSFYTGLSQFLLPLPVTHTIACSGTIFVFIIDYLINGTKINRKQVVGIIFGILGVFLTSNGKLLTKIIYPEYEYKTKFQNYITTDPIYISIFTFTYSIITVLWAYGIVLTRMAKANTFQINFILGIVFYVMASIALPYMTYLNYQKSSLLGFAKVVAFTGLPCFVVQILVITSLTMTKQTGVLNVMGFSMILVSYLISIFRYEQTPNLICLIGIVLVFSGVFKTVFNTRKQ